MPAKRLESDQGPSVNYTFKLRDAPRDHVGQLVVASHADHRHYVGMPGDRIDLRYPRELGQFDGEVRDAGGLPVDQDEGVDHGGEANPFDGPGPSLGSGPEHRRYDPRVPAPVPPVSMIRPALELAWAVAKVGSQLRPPPPMPGRLRPLMKVTRLPDRMLGTVREVVDTDEAFRARVINAADEELLGRPSWLWLVRPEGFEDDLGALIQQVELAQGEAEEKRSTRATQHQLDEARAAVQKLRAEMVSLNAVNAQLAEQLAEARRARWEADSESARVRAALGEALAGQDELRTTMAEHVETIRRLEGEGRAAIDRSAGAELRRDEAIHQTDVLELALAEAQRQAASANELASNLRRSLGEVLAAARDAAAAAGVEARGSASEQTPASTATATPAPESGGVTSPRPRSPETRVPARLPPATFEHSPEAARHLVRLPDAVLVVDGYNVTLSSWPGTDLPMQRSRLVDSLAELVMRTGTEVLVVFDGIEAGNGLQLPSSVRGRMRVRFTASETEADEAIIEVVESLPARRPVVVATNDRRVREAVRERGSNVISVDQLLAVLGRGPGQAG